MKVELTALAVKEIASKPYSTFPTLTMPVTKKIMEVNVADI